MSLTSAEQVPTLPAAGSPPDLRLLPVPVCEPPYDDEVAVDGRPGPALAPTWATPVGPLRALPPSPLRLVPTPGADLDLDVEEPTSRRTPTRELPPARLVARALVQGLLEVLAGVRPVAQLQRATTPELFAELEAFVHGRPRGAGPRPATGAVRSVHVQDRPEGVAEVCATVQRGSRAAAIALRLEGVDGRWRCTELAGL